MPLTALTQRPSPAWGTAVLGAYLNSIGLSEAAVAYVTMAAPNSMTWLTLQEAARYGIDVRPLSTAALPPQARRDATVTTTTTIPMDTHGLLGTWSCTGSSTQWADGYSAIHVGLNGVMHISKFDGRYYWAEVEAYYRTDARIILNDTKQMSKAKLWFDGGKLYYRDYWWSDPARLEMREENPTKLFTLNDNMLVGDHVTHITYQGIERTHRSSVRCVK
jgi:hypothetical protein